VKKTIACDEIMSEIIEEEEEEHLFAKRLVARKGFSPSTLATVNTNITCRNN